MLYKDAFSKINISEVIYICYDLLVPISDNRILATHGDKISLIDTIGKMICTYDMIIIPTIEDDLSIIETDKHEFETKSLNIGGYLIIIQEQKQGLIDYDGNIIIDAIYNQIKFNNEGNIEVLP